MAMQSIRQQINFLSKFAPKSLLLNNLNVHSEIVQGRTSLALLASSKRDLQTSATYCIQPLCITSERCCIRSNGLFSVAPSVSRTKYIPIMHVYSVNMLCFGARQSKLSVSCFSSDSCKPNSTSEPEKIRKEDISTDAKLTGEQEYKKLSLVQRYKKMLKEYWYVLIPVHIATSIVWFGSFYYAAKSGIDIVPYLEVIGVSEVILRPLRNSGLGYLAVASAMYKIATPARYMVTLGGTTFAIKYLSKRGIIKPMPSKDQLKSILNKKLASSKDRTNSAEKK